MASLAEMTKAGKAAVGLAVAQYPVKTLEPSEAVEGEVRLWHLLLDTAPPAQASHWPAVTMVTRRRAVP